MMNNELLNRACETAAGYLALGNVRFVVADGTFVRNREIPGRYDSNHAGSITATTPIEIDALLERAEVEFAGYTHRRFDVDAFSPPEFIARLVLDGGYSAWDTLWLVLEGELQAQPRRADIREVLNESDWRAFERLAELDARENSKKHGRAFNPAYVVDFCAAKRLKCPPVRVWHAFADGEARAYFSSWPGENGVGMVEDLFTEPKYRHRGLATALIAHSVADARARGAGPVIIGADPNDTPKQMYAAMGFRPLYVSHNYVKLLH
jgi:GNAT superfamily N-acetyltransferase